MNPKDDLGIGAKEKHEQAQRDQEYFDSNIHLSSYQQKLQKQNIKIMKAIEAEPRITLKDISGKTGLPLTTVHDRYKMIIELFELKGKWVRK